MVGYSQGPRQAGTCSERLAWMECIVIAHTSVVRRPRRRRRVAPRPRRVGAERSGGMQAPSPGEGGGPWTVASSSTRSGPALRIAHEHRGAIAPRSSASILSAGSGGVAWVCADLASFPRLPPEQP